MYQLTPRHLFIHEGIKARAEWRDRAERIGAGLGEAGRAPIWFADEDIPALAAEHNWAEARRRMGHYAELDDPDLLLNVFTFDDSNVERVREIGERCPEVSRGLAGTIMGRGSF